MVFIIILALFKFLNHEKEKEKMLLTYSICYLHFYTNFTYENTFQFDEFCTQELINSFTKYNVFIKDLNQFRIFCYTFYYQLVKEINKINYKEFKNLYQLYNPKIIPEEKIIEDLEPKSPHKIIDMIKSYTLNINKINLKDFKANFNSVLSQKVLKPMVSTTERIVDMVLSVNYTKTKTSSIRCPQPPVHTSIY